MTLEDGIKSSARFLITAVGPLSAPTMPRIPGVADFKGEAYHTGTWPHHDVSFAGKKVAVIGTGATGVQTIQEVAKTVGHLTVFQRTSNWCKPLKNAKIGAEEQKRIKAGYPEMFRHFQAARRRSIWRRWHSDPVSSCSTCPTRAPVRR